MRDKRGMNNRGLSTIVVTLILVLLSVVAVGVVWVVINNIVQSSSEQINTGTACLDVGSVTAVSIANTTGIIDGSSYELTMKRGSGKGDIGGVKVTLFSGTGNSDVVDLPGNIAALQTVTKTVVLSPGVTNVNKAEVTPYLTDEAGGAACSTSTKNF